MRIAVVGSGIAGLATAWLLSSRHEVVLYEAERRLGGHAHTVGIEIGKRAVAVDTGFIVYNELNYPNLTALFAHLDVRTADSDMSFAVSIDRGRYEYSGSLTGLLAQPANAVRPAHWEMIRDAVRFYRAAPGLLERGETDGLTIGEMLARGGYSRAFLDRHLLPMAAAIWSCPLGDVSRMPAETFIRFFDNHRLFSLGERPR
ncbi:MAG: FAD-dependent oxidoreductase, partial [Alphaproteobacteria bacterium]